MKPFVKPSLLIIILSVYVFSTEVVSEGEAILGNGITLESAEGIALNNAKQKALEQMGVFIESQTKTINSMLVKDEVRTMAGSIMKTEVLSKTKKIVSDQIIVVISAKCLVDDSVFTQTIKKYAVSSQNTQLIKSLADRIVELQNQLLNQQSSPTDDQAFKMTLISLASAQRDLSNYLTSGQIISRELTIQKEFKRKFAAILFSDAMERWKKMKEFNDWPKVPTQEGDCGWVFQIPDTLYNCFIGARPKECTKYIDLQKEYSKLELKMRPNIEMSAIIVVPISFYINSNIYDLSIWMYLQHDDNGSCQGWGARRIESNSENIHMYSPPFCPSSIPLPYGVSPESIEDTHFEVRPFFVENLWLWQNDKNDNNDIAGLGLPIKSTILKSTSQQDQISQVGPPAALATTGSAGKITIKSGGSEGKITITSSPSGATVKADDKVIGVTPFVWNKPSVFGGVLVSISKKGYKDGVTTIEFTGMSVSVSFKLDKVE
jgi:hypothetical protein